MGDPTPVPSTRPPSPPLRSAALGCTALSCAVLALTAVLPAPPAWVALVSAAALLAAVGIAGAVLARHALPTAPVASRASAGFCFALALLVLPATALGHFGLLAPHFYLTLEAVLAATVVAAAEIRAAYVPPDRGRPALRRNTHPPTAVWERAVQGAAWAGVAAMLLMTLHHDLYRPPSYLDDPSYHFTTVATWVQHGDLRTPKFAYGDPSTAHYPLGSELVAWALVAPLRDSDFLARWLQIPFLAALLAAVAAIGRRLGIGRATLSLCALLLLTVRRLFPDLFASGGNDLVLAACLVAAVDALLALGRRRSAGHALYLGTSLGLALGTKYLALLQALPLLLAVVALPWLTARRTTPRPDDGLQADRPLPYAAALAWVAVAAALAGGYTYLRNLVSAGNPVFPLPLDLGPLHLPGWQEVTLATRRHLPEFVLDPWHHLVVDASRWGPLFRITLLPAALLAPLAAIARRRPGWRLHTLVLALPALHYAIFALQVHDHRDVRYLFPAAALAAVGFGYLLQVVATRRPTLAAAVRPLLAFAALLFFVPWDEQPLPLRFALAGGLCVIGAAAGILGGAALRAAEARLQDLPERRRALLAAVLPVTAVLFVALALAPTLRRYPRRVLDASPLVAELARRAPLGATVAAAGGNRPYPLFGPRFQNRVEIVPLQGPPERRFFTWGGDGGALPDDGTEQSWIANLRALEVGYVVLDKGSGEVREEDWVEARPDLFRPLLTAGDRELFQLLRSAPPAKHEDAATGG